MAVVIVDYGMGNLFSVKKILDTLGADNFISAKPEDLLKADKIILPGVGSFHAAMENLKKYQLIDALNQAHQSKKPIWGICLGMQLMAKRSSEGGNIQGLGWLDAEVKQLKVPDHLRVPHIGWNNVKILQTSPLFKSFLEQPTFYFTHSYAMRYHQVSEIIGECNYGIQFPVAIQKENLFGTQFHPEKSQLNGKILIENFLNWRV